MLTRPIKPLHAKTTKVLHQNVVPVVRRGYTTSKRNVKTHVTGLESQLVTTSYYLGKGIILFTFFYCSLNWLHYRSVREKWEKEDDDKKP